MNKHKFAKVIIQSVICFFVARAEAVSPTPCTGEVASQVLMTAVSNAIGLGYVRAALESAVAENGGPEFSKLCYTGVALKKNIFQYYKFLIRIEVRSLKSKSLTHNFNLLFQDASTQAHHNTGEKPWVGLSNGELRAVIAKGIEDLQFGKSALDADSGFELRRAVAESPLFQRDFSKSSAKDTLSFLRLSAGSKQIFLTTWMTPTAESLYAGSEIPGGFVHLIDVTTGRSEMADLSWLQSRFLFPLEELIYKQLEDLSYADYESKLLELSKR